MNWEIGTTMSGKIGIWDPNGTGKTICIMPGYDEDQKNAALIAAAPEMLELLSECLVKLDANNSNDWESIKVVNLKNKIFNLLQVLNNKPVNL